MNLTPKYSKKKTVAKGLQTTLLSLITLGAGVAASALQSPDVVAAITKAWPGLPVAAAAGVSIAFINWLKHRDR